LIIHGSQDLRLPVEGILKTAKLLGKLDLWEGHGHMIPIEDTPRFVKAIKDFI
jgi:pimeloyl-ACP methyl ester carboxylesterase